MPSCCTCGSLAALRMTVRPLASTAAMRAFSVAVTDGSSSRMSAPDQPAGVQAVAGLARVELRAELPEREEVRVVAAPADDVTTGKAELHLLHARKQRPGEEERGADLAGKRCGTLARVQLAGDAYGVWIELLDSRAERGDDLEHAADVTDARDVVKRDRVVGEQRWPR